MRSWILFAGAFFCAWACATPQASLELLPHATVAGSHLTLGTVARLHSNDLALIRMLVDFPVGVLARPGDFGVWTRAALAERMRRQGVPAEVRLEWSGATEVRVARASHHVSGHAIGEAALSGVREWLSELGAPQQVVLAIEPRDLQVPPGAVRLQVRRQTLALQRRTTAWVDVWAGGVHVRAVPVSLEMPWSAALPRAGGLAWPPRAAVTPALQRAEAGPAVGRGEWGALRASSGAVTLESRVEVLQDGRPGETVRVRRGPNAVVSARVVGRGELELAP